MAKRVTCPLCMGHLTFGNRESLQRHFIKWHRIEIEAEVLKLIPKMEVDKR